MIFLQLQRIRSYYECIVQRKANIATGSKDSLAKIHHSITHAQAKTYINW